MGFRGSEASSPAGIAQAILAISGAIWIGLAWKALASPSAFIEISDRRMRLTLVYPLGISRHGFGPGDVKALTITSGIDTDAERFHVACLDVDSLARLEPERSPDRADAKRVVAGIRDAMELPPDRG